MKEIITAVGPQPQPIQPDEALEPNGGQSLSVGESPMKDGSPIHDESKPPEQPGADEPPTTSALVQPLSQVRMKTASSFRNVVFIHSSQFLRPIRSDGNPRGTAHARPHSAAEVYVQFNRNRSLDETCIVLYVAADVYPGRKVKSPQRLRSELEIVDAIGNISCLASAHCLSTTR